jgi:hypothetical protein
MISKEIVACFPSQFMDKLRFPEQHDVFSLPGLEINPPRKNEDGYRILVARLVGGCIRWMPGHENEGCLDRVLQSLSRDDI